MNIPTNANLSIFLVSNSGYELTSPYLHDEQSSVVTLARDRFTLKEQKVVRAPAPRYGADRFAVIRTGYVRALQASDIPILP